MRTFKADLRFGWVVVLGMALIVVLSGCSASGAFVGSPHGYCGSGTISGERFVACPTIVPDGAKPMGSRVTPDGTQEDMYSTITDGSLSATGLAAIAYMEAKRLEQLLLICAVAPQSSACLGG